MRMSVSSRACDKRKDLSELDLHDDVEDDLLHGRPDSPLLDGQPRMHDQEKRLRREVANSNERRRMQSINAGFQSLRNLIPHGDGEKLSKAAILQQTVGYIAALESEKTRLLSVNQQLHQMLQDKEGPKDLSPTPKRKKRDTESSDEGIGMTIVPADLAMDDQNIVEVRREMVALRKVLDRERSQRIALEKQNCTLEEQVYPAKIRQAASEIQVERYQEEQWKLQNEEKPSRERTWSEPAQKSSRNMEILLEAFRVIEGDRGLFASDEKNHPKSEPMSDEDMSSGCESPLSRMSDSDGKIDVLSSSPPMMPLHPAPLHLLLPPHASLNPMMHHPQASS